MTDRSRDLQVCTWADRDWNWNNCWIGDIGRKGGEKKMRKVTIETILDHYNKKTEEVYGAERNELIPLFTAEFPEYELDFGYSYGRSRSVIFRDGRKSICIRFWYNAMFGFSCRRVPRHTFGKWSQKEVNDIKKRIERLGFDQ